MKKLVIACTALSLLAGPAFAQSHHWRQNEERHDRVMQERAFERGYNAGARGHFMYRGRNYNRVRGPAWAPPRGWAYRRYAVGAYVPRNFLGASFIVNPLGLGVQVRPAPYGTHWMRVGDDLLLVSWRTGRVIEVVPDVFY